MNFKKFYFNKLIKEQDRKYWGNKGAGVLVYCPQTKRFLLGFRSAYVNEPHTWGTFGGKFDDEIEPVAVAKRELYEETKYDGPIKLEQFDVYRRPDFTFYNFLGIVPEEFRAMLDWENQNAEWFRLEEFPNNLHYGLKLLVNKLPEIIAKYK